MPLKTLGFAAVFLPGIVMLYAIPVLFPNDDDELGPAQFVFVLVTVATIAGAAICVGARRNNGVWPWV